MGKESLREKKGGLRRGSFHSSRGVWVIAERGNDFPGKAKKEGRGYDPERKTNHGEKERSP